MRIAMNAQSVDALRDFAQKIPLVMETIESDTMELMRKFSAVEEIVGPHARDFQEMLSLVKNAQELSADSIRELSYMLSCTADKMEAYLLHGASHGTILYGNRDIQGRYNRCIMERLNAEGTNPIVKDLYGEIVDSIRVTDYDYQDTAFYNSASNGICLNAMADMHNCCGNMSTYFHEVGHFADDISGNGHAWLSSDPKYAECLKNDFDALVSRTMVQRHCEKFEAYDIISEEISGVWTSGISDICGALTACRCQGDWGHSPEYWEKEPSRVEKEAFANMFEASIGDNKKLTMMKNYFPTAYSRFEAIIKGRNVDND